MVGYEGTRRVDYAVVEVFVREVVDSSPGPRVLLQHASKCWQ